MQTTKVNNKNQQKKEFLKILKEEKNYWDKYKDNLKLNFNKSDNNKSSLNKSSFGKEKKMIKENKKEEDIYKDLGDNEKRI